MSVFKMLHLNLLNILIMLTLKVVLGYPPIILGTIYTISKPNILNSTLKETSILWFQLYVAYQNIISIKLFTIDLVVYRLLV